MSVHVHIDCSPGLTMEGVKVEQSFNHGKPCFKATSKIKTIFGQEVDGGEIKAYGTTEEQAMQRLTEERKKLHESL